MKFSTLAFSGASALLLSSNGVFADDTKELGPNLGKGSVLNNMRDNKDQSDFLELVTACNNFNLTRLVSEVFTTDFNCEGKQTLSNIDESVLLAFIPSNGAFKDEEAFKATLEDSKLACDVVAGQLAIVDKSNFENAEEVKVTTLFGTELSFKDAKSMVDSEFEGDAIVFNADVPFTKPIEGDVKVYVPGSGSNDNDGSVEKEKGEDDDEEEKPKEERRRGLFRRYVKKGLPGMPDMANLPGMPDMANLPGVPDMANLPGMPGNVPGMPGAGMMFKMPNFSVGSQVEEGAPSYTGGGMKHSCRGEDCVCAECSAAGYDCGNC